MLIEFGGNFLFMLFSYRRKCLYNRTSDSEDFLPEFEADCFEVNLDSVQMDCPNGYNERAEI